MNRLLAIFALLGFVLSLVVHIAALSGIDVAGKIPLVWSLHVGIFVAFIPFVLLSRKELGPKPTFTQLKGIFPSWVGAICAVICAYALVNFLLFMLATHGGSPSIRDGKFILQDHGRLIREITSGEYASFKANEVRGFSGHWLAFYFVPFAYFMFRKKSTSSIHGTAFGSP